MANHQIIAMHRQMQMPLDSNDRGNIIAGLREQIFANAVHAFPLVIKDHTPLNTTGVIVPPNRIFDVIISRPPSTTDDTPCFQAILTYGPPFARKSAVFASTSDSVIGALENLVSATGRIIAQTMGTITEDLKDVSIETYGAKYNWELISKSKELSSKNRGK